MDEKRINKEEIRANILKWLKKNGCSEINNVQIDEAQFSFLTWKPEVIKKLQALLKKQGIDYKQTGFTKTSEAQFTEVNMNDLFRLLRDSEADSKKDLSTTSAKKITKSGP